MRFPRPIRKGDAIGVTAPSSGITDPLDLVRQSSAVSQLGLRGYDVRMTRNVFTDEGGRSSSGGEKCEQFASLLRDPDVGCIVAAKGGDYQIDMLPIFDWGLWEQEPKWFQGYSDNTVLAFKATAEHDIASIYAGNFSDFGMRPWHRSIEDDLALLEGKASQFQSYPFHEDGFHDRVTGTEAVSDDSPTWWMAQYCEERFSGRLIGGCMDVLEWFVRTDSADPSRFIGDYGSDGIVWYMETYDMDADRVRKMFSLMGEKGWLKDASGFVFGRPLFFEGEYIDTVMDCISDLEVPAVFDADVGHKAPRMPFVNGALADFAVSDGACTLKYAFRRLGNGYNINPRSEWR